MQATCVNPRKERMNIFKKARQAAGMTQVHASMELHIGLRTLQYYEQDGVPPQDVRCAMAKLYGAPYLSVDPRSPGVATNVFMKELDDVIDRRRELQAITYDDTIDVKEREHWEEICHELHELAMACTALGSVG